MPTTLELTDREREALLTLLEDQLGSLREQVYHSETPAFRDELKVQKELIQQLVTRLKEAPVQAKAS